MRINYILLSIFSLLLFNSLQAQKKTSFGIGGGGAKIIGKESEYFEFGYNVHTEIFTQISDPVALGVRVGYNRLKADGEKIIKDQLGYPYFGEIENTSVGILEMTPNLRFTTKDNGAQLFFQAGGGLYVLMAKTTVNDNKGSNMENGFGYDLAAGFLFGDDKTKVALYPMYNRLTVEGESSTYLSFNISLLFY